MATFTLIRVSLWQNSDTRCKTWSRDSDIPILAQLKLLKPSLALLIWRLQTPSKLIGGRWVSYEFVRTAFVSSVEYEEFNNEMIDPRKRSGEFWKLVGRKRKVAEVREEIDI